MNKQTVWVGTSWKMNKTLAEAMVFADGLAAADANRDARIQRFVIPPFTATRQVKDALEATSVKVGAQNMHWDDAGAWTGEISPLMLKDCKLDLVELGHSERREHFGETDRTVGLKTAAAVRHGLVPLICIGETLAEREAGQADAVLRRQVEGALGLLEGAAKNKPVLLAYEPVWAIGVNGIPASADYADERHALIGNWAQAMLGVSVPVLYGGSVNPGNCEELIAKPHIDGLFIGRSAWDVASYLDILSKVSAALAA
ncbi:triose-phosphate isomerase [Pararhizobium antarcticum]|uniref:Triosephosphate isomerase n=1 Tax=Pararhizobium antarcticum TaxID=1798805 RepID=A0A657LNU5_9HYPH|nr:triose-phosphate isomerase [Pararhizobium antarcticum]OJF92486.1 triose-phosphate isomerase [Pararhizobium antarcticum]OJF99682.1 triose-phosphate isomerase [Rhizobium sp. 58]